MCRSVPSSSNNGEKIDSSKISGSGGDENKNASKTESQPVLSPRKQTSTLRRRRRKTDKQVEWSKELTKLEESTAASSSSHNKRIVKKKKKTKMTAKHQNDSQSGGMDALIPSLIGVVVLIVVVMAKMGFRGRATVAGIDLGTTNSVVCVQAPSSGVGEIVCIPDPATNSPVIPSVVSFLDNHHTRNFRTTKEEKEAAPPGMFPHPVDVVVGQAAKDRINTHPHHTVYHAKRIIGRKYNHDSVNSLVGEVDYDILSNDESDGDASFGVPYHLPTEDATTGSTATQSSAIITPSEIGSYIIHHLRTLTRNHLQHDNVNSAVIAIPAKFEPAQRDATIRAFELAGLKVARILEEPTAAALAYGLHKRDDVHYVMVYDFGGGTLDISLLFIGEGGNIEVIGSDGDEQLGGADFDAAVAHWLLERNGGDEIVKDVMASIQKIEASLNNDEEGVDVEDSISEHCTKLNEAPLCTLSSLHTIGEQMKIGLSGHPNEETAFVEKACYRLPAKNESIPDRVDELCDAIVPVSFKLSLEEYDIAASKLYDRSLIPIQTLLKDLDLQKEEIDEVVMVGGTTRMPQIRELVRQELGKERLNTHIDPDLTVAYGAASVID
mmetsp:Transcript_4973/g.7240  ORF Transcript_4973/g.7240 Transcript_4973/m.7240 type:complete len:608 (+) Transcript_4973:72-1895(+)